MPDNFDSKIKSTPYGSLLNLGCGKVYYPDWTNIDFIAPDSNVIQYDLTRTLPFSDNSFNVVYHSHVLEHFTASQGESFIKECFRVLKPGGLIRIAVPDLEQIARNYIKYLESTISGDHDAFSKYEWSKIELLDQVARNSSGGAYNGFLREADELTRSFARERLGKEIDYIETEDTRTLGEKVFSKSLVQIVAKAKQKIVEQVVGIIGGSRSRNALNIGRFRISGEIHQCMYDRLSLQKLLTACGFSEIFVRSAFESSIPGFMTLYNLDGSNGAVRKPDSLFMEAKKK